MSINKENAYSMLTIKSFLLNEKDNARYWKHEWLVFGEVSLLLIVCVFFLFEVSLSMHSSIIIGFSIFSVVFLSAYNYFFEVNRERKSGAILFFISKTVGDYKPEKHIAIDEEIYQEFVQFTKVSQLPLYDLLKPKLLNLVTEIHNSLSDYKEIIRDTANSQRSFFKEIKSESNKPMKEFNYLLSNFSEVIQDSSDSQRSLFEILEPMLIDLSEIGHHLRATDKMLSMSYETIVKLSANMDSIYKIMADSLDNNKEHEETNSIIIRHLRELNLGKLHLSLFSEDLQSVDYALKEISGLCTEESLVHLNAFIGQRQDDSSFQTQVEEAKQIVAAIKRKNPN